MCDSVNENEAGYPEGVVLLKTLPYRVRVGSEVYHILKSLNEHGNLSQMEISVAGEFTASVMRYMGRLSDPYEAFVCAFYEKAKGIYLPVEMSSMETAAWMMAENAFAYQKLLFGNSAGKNVTIAAYDAAIRLLKSCWNPKIGYWKCIVNAYWVTNISA